MSAKVMIALNTAWNLINFRAGLIQGLLSSGYQVIIVAPEDSYASRISTLGCGYVPLPMDNMGTHPGRDLALFWQLLRLMRKQRPDVFLGFTIKPNIYGSLAAHALGIPVINNIAGLGTAFVQGGWLNHLVKGLYRLALARSQKVFFQNEEDRQLFVSDGIIPELIGDRLPGSGIDLERFSPEPLPNRSRIRFLLIARMLWQKGVGEFVEAARILKQRGLDADFCLLGFLDAKNPTAISRSQIDEWMAEGVVRYLGVSDDVREQISQADCIVLPSFYREGTPRALLEAAAMGRPIITSDSVGCRDVVQDGVSGFLCRPRSGPDLAEKIARVIAMSGADRQSMGLRGRQKIEQEFDERIVINRYLQAIMLTLKRKERNCPIDQGQRG